MKSISNIQEFKYYKPHWKQVNIVRIKKKTPQTQTTHTSASLFNFYQSVKYPDISAWSFSYTVPIYTRKD